METGCRRDELLRMIRELLGEMTAGELEAALREIEESAIGGKDGRDREIATSLRSSQ